MVIAKFFKCWMVTLKMECVFRIKNVMHMANEAV